METKRSHKPEAFLDLIVHRADGSVREERSFRPEPSKPDMLSLVVRDYDGVVVSEKEFPVQSFVQNYSEQLYHSMIGGASSDASIIDTSGAAQTLSSHYIDIDAGNDQDELGIQVGVGSTAVTVTDHHLAIKVDHGTGAGQLDYNQNLSIEATTSGTDTVHKTYRTFENSSGGTITVQEVALVADCEADRFLILRDVEDENSDAIDIAVADAETLTATYTFTCTQASGFTLQYLHLMNSAFFGRTGPLDIKYVGGSGATRSFNARSLQLTWMQIQADAAEAGWGVVVGTDNTALDSEDYRLGTLIEHGSGSGQLSYDEVTYEEVAVDGDDVTFGFKRAITNLSGSTINIEEAGIYVMGETDYHFMIVRSLTETLEMANGESITVKYTFKHTV